jgi:hypothetical protein
MFVHHAGRAKEIYCKIFTHSHHGSTALCSAPQQKFWVTDALNAA